MHFESYGLLHFSFLYLAFQILDYIKQSNEDLAKQNFVSTTVYKYQHEFYIIRYYTYKRRWITQRTRAKFCAAWIIIFCFLRFFQKWHRISDALLLCSLQPFCYILHRVVVFRRYDLVEVLEIYKETRPGLTLSYIVQK